MIYRPKNPPGGGKPLIDLPQRQDQIIRIDLTPQERDVYDYIRNLHPFKSNWAKMIRMRQGENMFHLYWKMYWATEITACDHPFLLSKAIDCTDVKTDDIAENMRAWCVSAITLPPNWRHYLNLSLDNRKCLETLESVEDLVANDVALRPLPAKLHDVRELFDPTYISTKMSAVLDILDDIASRPLREKTIIFASLVFANVESVLITFSPQSHFITVLSLIGDVLDDNQIRFTTCKTFIL